MKYLGIDSSEKAIRLIEAAFKTEHILPKTKKHFLVKVVKTVLKDPLDMGGQYEYTNR